MARHDCRRCVTYELDLAVLLVSYGPGLTGAYHFNISFSIDCDYRLVQRRLSAVNCGKWKLLRVSRIFIFCTYWRSKIYMFFVNTQEFTY